MTTPTASDVLAGLTERYKTIVSTPKLAVLGYEPRSVQTSPLIYTILERFTSDKKGGILVLRLTFLSRICVKWQDNQQAEQQLCDLIVPVVEAIEADRRLNNRIQSGLTLLPVGEAGYTSIGDASYRTCDLHLDVVVK